MVTRLEPSDGGDFIILVARLLPGDDYFAASRRSVLQAGGLLITVTRLEPGDCETLLFHRIGSLINPHPCNF